MAILSSPLQIIASTPITTRSFTASTVGFSLLYYLLRWLNNKPSAAPFITLVPGESIFYPWTFVTAGLVEVTLIEVFLCGSCLDCFLTECPQLVLTLVFVPVSLRYLERLWGAIETLKFIVVVTAIPNVISFALNWLEFLVFRNADLFLYVLLAHTV